MLHPHVTTRPLAALENEQTPLFMDNPSAEVIRVDSLRRTPLSSVQTFILYPMHQRQIGKHLGKIKQI